MQVAGYGSSPDIPTMDMPQLPIGDMLLIATDMTPLSMDRPLPECSP